MNMVLVQEGVTLLLFPILHPLLPLHHLQVRFTALSRAGRIARVNRRALDSGVCFGFGSHRVCGALSGKVGRPRRLASGTWSLTALAVEPQLHSSDFPPTSLAPFHLTTSSPQQVTNDVPSSPAQPSHRRHPLLSPYVTDHQPWPPLLERRL